jgi:transcriptional regulator CBF1
MDQAMGDLQAQLEEVRRAWDEERAQRQRLESELQVLRGLHGSAPPAGPSSGSPTQRGVSSAEDRIPPKRTHDEGDRVSPSADDTDERAKRPRVE